ncbi:hypothetical protein FH972_002713 [Carpinus fangiana]|uniref:Uncharacterized protein n=1 Tax=Carpinus fangiana TaxID=176857 RepID=A0A5N6QFP3_9ROSI|nr:hypothetical protein FH972_002713 [Carpinus fangiana]
MTVFFVDDLSISTPLHRLSLTRTSAMFVSTLCRTVPLRSPTLRSFLWTVETTIPTLEQGQSLVVTTAGGGLLAEPTRINYVRIKAPEVMRNLKIYQIHPVASAYDQILGGKGTRGSPGLGSEVERSL